MNIIMEKPDDLILDLSSLKSHLRIIHNLEDEYLKNIISMATEILEKATEISILRKKYKYTYCCDDFETTMKILLPIRQVVEVVSVKELQPTGKFMDINYKLTKSDDRITVITRGSRCQIEIEYTAGITDRVADVPKDLQFAVLQISKNIYECSEEDVLESKYIRHIINSNRIPSIS